MLATLTDRRDFGEDWLLERKLDGERCVARKDGADVRLESRTGKDLTGTYPEVRTAVAAQAGRRSCCSMARWSPTTASRLPSAASSSASESPSPSPQLVAHTPSSTACSICSSSTARISPADLCSSAARGWTQAIRPSDALQLIEAWRGDSERRFAEACRSGWEGLIAKRADAPYTQGRSRDWLKLKCAWEQEFVIGGFTDPAGSRTDFGALLVGYHEDGRLRYAGKVGTGYSAATLHDLGARLRALETRRVAVRSTRDRSRAARTGPARSSSPRSASPSGRPTVACASRAFSACATTSARPRSSASARRERDTRQGARCSADRGRPVGGGAGGGARSGPADGGAG